jgi:hypothetical protein
LIIGDIPPAGLRDERYIVAALLGAAIAFAIFSPVAHIPSWILITRRRRPVAVRGVGDEQGAAVRR